MIDEIFHFSPRILEGLLYIDPYDPVVQNELNSGKFSVLARRDTRTGAAIALFTASLHSPTTASHQSVLKVMKSIDTKLLINWLATDF